MKLHRCEPNHECVVGRNIVPVLEGVMEEIEAVVQSKLGERTIADVAQSIQERG